MECGCKQMRHLQERGGYKLMGHLQERGGNDEADVLGVRQVLERHPGHLRTAAGGMSERAVRPYSTGARPETEGRCTNSISAEVL